MAKIARVTQKIFAGNSATNQVTTFGSIKAGTPVYSKSASDIMNSNFEGGWTSAVEDDYAPYRQDRNAIDLTFSQQIAYILQEGCPEYDSGTTYFKNGIVKSVDGTNTKFYVSIANNNTSALTNTTKWKLFMTVSNTGDVTINALVPTQAAGDNTTKAASTAFVTAAIAALNGAISSIKTSNLTASRAIVSNASGKIAVSSTTSTELGYVHGVTSNIQTQIDNLVKERVYPVGAFYITKTNTNPSTVLGFGTWTLLTSSVVTGVANSASVLGNGKSLGLTDGTNTAGLSFVSTSSLTGYVGNYNKTVGTANSGSPLYSGGKVVGVVTSGESGLIADTSNLATSVTIYIWERTA